MKIGVALAALGCALAWSSLAAAQTPAQNAAKACDELGEAMPYTVERTDEVVQLQLAVIGLSLDKTAVPPISADASGARMRRETVGAVSQALDRVAAVHFCRLKQIFPNRIEELEAAEQQFQADVSNAFTPENYASLTATAEARTFLTAQPKPAFRATQSALNSALVAENFTRIEMTQTSVGIDILGFANARGCGGWIRQSAAQSSGVFLVTLADARSLIIRYLTSDSQTGLARGTLMNHAKALYQSPHASEIVRTMTPTLTTCLTETAQHASEVLPPPPSTPETPADPATPSPPTTQPAPATSPAAPR